MKTSKIVSAGFGAVHPEVPAKNIPNMLTQFTGVFSKKGGNVSGMISKAKGDYAYSILDIGVEPTADDIAELSAIEGVVKVRVIK